MAVVKTGTITIPASRIDADLTNYPVRMFINNTRFMSGMGSTDWQKLQILSGSTDLYIHVEQWDDTDGWAIINFKAPSLSSSVDNTFTLNFLDTTNLTYVGETGDAAAQQVWSNGYYAVYHLNQSTFGASSILDATSNALHATPTGLDASNIFEVLGARYKGIGYAFNGLNEMITRASFNRGANAFTLEATLSFSSQNATYGGWVASQRDSSSSDQYQLFCYPPSDPDAIGFNCYSAVGTPALSSALQSQDANINNVINFAIATDGLSGHAVNMYRNGAFEATGNLLANMAYGASNLYIAKAEFLGANGWWQGGIFEIKISNVERSASWLKASNLGLGGALADFSYTGGVVDTVELTISSSNIDNELDNFPVRIILNSTNSEFMTDLISTDWQKLQVLQHGVELYTEVEEWDVTNDKCILNAKSGLLLTYDDAVFTVNLLSATNLAYVGIPGSSNGQKAFAAQYEVMLHLDDDALDSTSHGRTPTINGSMAFGEDSNFKYAHLDAINDYMQFGSTLTLTGDVSFAFGYYKAAEPPAFVGIICRNITAAGYTGLGVGPASGGYTWHVDMNTGSTAAVTFNPTMPSSWKTIVFSREGSTLSMYVDGVFFGSAAIATGSVLIDVIGYRPVYVTNKHEFYLTDFAILSEAISAGWAKLHHMSLTGTLFSISEPETPAAGGGFGKILVNESFKDITAVKLAISGQWKTINSGQLLVSGQWKTLSSAVTTTTTTSTTSTTTTTTTTTTT